MAIHKKIFRPQITPAVCGLITLTMHIMSTGEAPQSWREAEAAR